MNSFYRSLAAYSPLIYIALAIWGLFVLRAVFRNWQEWKNSVYSLESEFALGRLVRSVTLGLIVLAFLSGQFFVTSFVVPALPASDILPTPTLDLLATPIDTLPPGAGTEVAALAPQPAPSGMSGCLPDQIMLTSPLPGAEVSGVVILNGTVNVQNFGFYKYEISSIGSNTWATISAGDKQVKDDVLGSWDTTTLANGDYFLQLVVIDNVGKTLDPCVLAVRVANR